MVHRPADAAGVHPAGGIVWRPSGSFYSVAKGLPMQRGYIRLKNSHFYFWPLKTPACLCRRFFRWWSRYDGEFVLLALF